MDCRIIGRGVDKGCKSNVRLKANNRLEVGLPTRISEQEYQTTCWDEGDTHYQQVTSNTLITRKIGANNESPQYRFILPRNFGGWSQDNTGSDGLIWKGCLSCHADNGAFSYAVHHSQEANAGKMVAAVIEAVVTTRLFVPSNGVKNLISIKNTAPQIGEEFGSLGATIVDGNISLSGRAVSNGKFDFVVTASGEIKIGTGHYNLSGGAAEVQAAGEIKLFRGRVMSITNSSGHYQPSVTQGRDFGNIFQKAGVNVSGAKLRLYNTNGTLHSTTILK